MVRDDSNREVDTSMNDAPARKQRAITSDKVKPNSPAARIIDKFGGLSKFCELCDFAHGTVHGWMVTGLIPAKTRPVGDRPWSYAAWILGAARLHEIDLSAADFIDEPGQLDG